MAETVVSMARVLVGSAVSKAASAAADEASLLIGVQKEIWYVQSAISLLLQSCFTVSVTPSLPWWSLRFLARSSPAVDWCRVSRAPFIGVQLQGQCLKLIWRNYKL